MFSSDKFDYKNKIKSLEELKAILGPRPRDKKVIMCHGTFDVVHPGHVRHLIYAHDKADILVASLTTDAHIEKANYRPFVPEQLRAMNLAALEFVDYVIIDSNAKPLDNLAELQPDYFAKGYEYGTDGVNPKTKEELEVIEGYGGEVIFTPGDIVYSSSTIIESTPPSIGTDKLAILMEQEGIKFSDLKDAIASFKNLKAHIIGDTIVDSYTYCQMVGWGHKTPTLSVRYDHQTDYVGGAGIVSKHVRNTGAQVKFSTILGNDKLKDFVLEDLEKAGVEVNAIIDETRPTTCKNAIIARGYRLLKVDTLDNRAINSKILESMKKHIQGDSSFDAVVFSDFRHGIFGPTTIPALTAAIPDGPIRVADSQVASRWGNILEFQGFDLITPNEKEARFALGDQDSVVRPMALNLYQKANCKNLILKLGERGILTYRDRGDGDPRRFFTIDAFTDNAVDAVGSGDALLSYATLTLALTKNEVMASILGSVSAALACEKDGNHPVNPEDAIERLSLIEKRIHYK